MRNLVYMMPFLVFFLLAGVMAYRLVLVVRGNSPDLIPSALLDKPAPPFNLPPLLEGKPGLKTADLKGKVTLLHFFASWCVDCREEHPVLKELAGKGIRLVGIDYKDRPDAAKVWLEKQGNPYDDVVLDSEGRTGIDFGLYGVPESYLIDKQGIIRFKQTGGLTPQIIENVVVPLADKLNQ